MKKVIALALTGVVLAMSIARPGQAEETSGCWGCFEGPIGGGEYGHRCGVQTPGFWNCSGGPNQCFPSSWGCGAGALLPVDADGRVTYATIDFGLPVDFTQRRPCDGVIVSQGLSEATASRFNRDTAVLTL